MNLNILKETFLILFKIFIFLIFLFGRTFTGFNVFGYRLGEGLIGLAFLIIIFYSIIYPILNKKYFLDDKKINLVIVLLILCFIVINFFNNSSFTNLFIYKTSTYIWSIGGIIIGYKFLDYFPSLIKRIDPVLSVSGLVIIYFFSTRGISENNQNILLHFTDKFEYPKGSDLLLAYIFVIYLLTNKLQFSNLSLNILMFLSALYIPLFLIKSRSGFISILIFLIILLPSFTNTIKNLSSSFMITIIISILIFLSSTSYVVSKNIIIDEEITEELKIAITTRYSSINDNKYEKEVLDLSLFYFQNGRIFTTDGNLNWRFQIWQDVFTDLQVEKKYFLGYGFGEIIPAMDNDQRTGQDKQNINVHNYFVHILSRGGYLNLFLIISLYYLIYKRFYSLGFTRDYFLIVLPLIFNSMFDPSMENPHYPLIFYFMIGLMLKKSILFKDSN